MLLGGVLTDVAGWRWVLFVNVPLGVAGGRARRARAAEHARRARPRGALDVPGASTITAALTALVYGVVETESLRVGLAADADRARGRRALALRLSLVRSSTRVADPLIPIAILSRGPAIAVGVLMI